ncbi:MAG: cytochrome [Prosthecobacter sp.]|nr:cytochrome [Prosthecobacter sp.]
MKTATPGPTRVHADEMSPAWSAALVLLAAMALTACEREKREFRAPSEAAVPAIASPLISVSVGGGIRPAPEPPYKEEENAYQVSEGRNLFDNFNCSTCHAQGGGDIGPPLIDEKWIYGSQPSQIYRSIIEGRPNGMPAFGSHLTTAQTRQIVSYVRHLSGLATGSASPGRHDHMTTAPPPNNASPQTPIPSSEPARR